MSSTLKIILNCSYKIQKASSKEISLTGENHEFKNRYFICNLVCIIDYCSSNESSRTWPNRS